MSCKLYGAPDKNQESRSRLDLLLEKRMQSTRYSV